jgi:acyl carrier protein
MPSAEELLPSQRGKPSEETKSSISVRDQIRQIVSEVLDRPVELEADFFTMGGNSIQASVVASRVAGAFGVRLAPQAFFENPTIVSLALRVEEAVAGARPDQRRVGTSGAWPSYFEIDSVSEAYPAEYESEEEAVEVMKRVVEAIELNLNRSSIALERLEAKLARIHGR